MTKIPWGVPKFFGRNVEIICGCVIILFCVLIVLNQVLPINSIPGRDGGAFLYIGSQIIKGKTLYVDVWDSKPPAIFYLNALAIWLGHGTRWGIWLLEFIFMLGSTLFGFTVMKQKWNFSTAIMGSICWLWGMNEVMGAGNFTEEYALLFNFIAIFFFWKSINNPQNKLLHILIGITLAGSFLLRANNIGIHISIALTILIYGIITKDLKSSIKKMLLWTTSFSFIIILFVLLFFMQHNLGQMIEAAFTYNFSYSSETTSILASLKAGFSYLGSIAIFGFIGYSCILLSLIINKKKFLGDTLCIFLLFALPVDILFSSISGRGYNHYFISWLPALALTVGFGFFSLLKLVFSETTLHLINKSTIFISVILVVLLSLNFSSQLVDYLHISKVILMEHSIVNEKTTNLVDYIKNETSTDAKVLVWGGQAGINFMSSRESPTAYIFYPGYVSSSPIASRLADGFLEDISNCPPVLIVDAYIHDQDHTFSLDSNNRKEQLLGYKEGFFQPHNLQEVFSFVQDNYHKVATIDLYDVYQLNR